MVKLHLLTIEVSPPISLVGCQRSISPSMLLNFTDISSQWLVNDHDDDDDYDESRARKKKKSAERLKSQTSDNYPSKNQLQQIRDFSTQVSTYENPSFVSNLSHPSGEFSKNVQYMNLHTIVYTHLICDHDSNIHAKVYSRTLGIGLENTQHWTPKVPPPRSVYFRAQSSKGQNGQKTEYSSNSSPKILQN